jgi:hypothetical protein
LIARLTLRAKAVTGNNPARPFSTDASESLLEVSVGHSRPKDKYSDSQVIRFRPHPSTAIEVRESPIQAGFLRQIVWRSVGKATDFTPEDIYG